jgi:hypothetical protein
MNKSSLNGTRHYQLVLNEEAEGTTRSIDFDAFGPDTALFRAEKECRGRDAELFEDGRSLGRIKAAAKGGFWVLTPSAKVKTAA